MWFRSRKDFVHHVRAHTVWTGSKKDIGLGLRGSGFGNYASRRADFHEDFIQQGCFGASRSTLLEGSSGISNHPSSMLGHEE